MEANEYERDIPVFDENSELQEKDVGEYIKKRANFDKLEMNMPLGNTEEDDRLIANANGQVSNNEETNKIEMRSVYKRNYNNPEINQNGDNDNLQMKTDETSQEADYSKDAESIEAGEWRNVRKGNQKRSEIVGKSFETELGELAFLGKKLDELSNQLSRKDVKNSTISKNIAMQQNRFIKKENMSYNGIAAKNDVILKTEASKQNGLEHNKSAPPDGLHRTLAGTVVVNYYTPKGTSNERNVSNIQIQRVGTVPKNDFNKQLLRRGYNDGKHRKNEQTGVKRGKVQESIRKRKKNSKQSKERDTFAIDTRTFQPISSKELYSFINEDVLRQIQLNKNSFGNLYTPKMVVREMQNKYIKLPGSSLENSDYGGSRRSFSTKYSDFHDFDKTWTKPKSAHIHPFFMFGIDHKETGVTQIDTLESDFFFNDDYRFPKEFQLNYHKRNRHLLPKSHNMKKRKKRKIPVALDWRDYGKRSALFYCHGTIIYLPINLIIHLFMYLFVRFLYIDTFADSSIASFIS